MKNEKEFTALVKDIRNSEVHAECGSYISKKAFKEDLEFDGFSKVLAIYNGALTPREAYQKYENDRDIRIINYPLLSDSCPPKHEDNCDIRIINYPPLSDLCPPKYGRLDPTNVY